MAVNLIGRECYICINHQDKYPLTFILCFTFSNYSADLLFLNKCALCLELKRLYSINLLLMFSLIFIISLDFSPFPHLHDKGTIPSLHNACMQFVYLFARCSALNAGSKALHGALLLSHRDILTLKDRDHKQKFCSLIATCSDFTGMVFTSDSTKRMVIFKISTGQTPFCHLLYVTSPKMVCNGH